MLELKLIHYMLLKGFPGFNVSRKYEIMSYKN